MKLKMYCRYLSVVWYKITIKRQIYVHCNLLSMTKTYSGKLNNDVRCDCAFNATVCMNAECSQQTLAVGISKVEVLIYSIFQT